VQATPLLVALIVVEVTDLIFAVDSIPAADLYEVPVWASPAFIAAVLAAVAILSIRDRRPGARTAGPRDRSPAPPPPVPISTGGQPVPAREAESRSPGSGRGPGSSG